MSNPVRMLSELHALAVPFQNPSDRHFCPIELNAGQTVRVDQPPPVVIIGEILFGSLSGWPQADRPIQ